MGEPLIMKEVLSDVTEHRSTEYSLYASKEPVVVGENCDKYDFIFHSIKGLHYEDYCNSEYLLIPLLRWNYPDEEVHAMLNMYEIYKENPNITTFALRDKRPKIQSSNEGEQIVYGTFIKFFIMKKERFGIEITKSDAYTVTDEDELRKVAGEMRPDYWKEFSQYISGLRLKN